MAGGANDELPVSPAEADPIEGADVDDFDFCGEDGPRDEAPAF